MSTPDLPPALPKPDELLALHGVTEAMFDTLRRWFEVPDTVTLSLHDIDAAVRELGDPVMIAALAMRKLQALRLLATPGVRTTTDVVVAIVGDLDRALVQAPAMRLQRQAASTDWDAELAGLAAPDPLEAAAPVSADDVDPEVEDFRAQHALLHKAVHAVLERAEGEVRYFE